jgi:hypothetical protein
MKIFYCFLVLFAVTVLLLLPITATVYNFRTVQKTDSFYETTGVGVTAANVTFNKALFNADASTVNFSSTLNTDVPVLVSYNSTNRMANVGGLTAGGSRMLSVSYDYDALGATSALSQFIDKVGWFWLLCVIGFVPASIAAIFTKKS